MGVYGSAVKTVLQRMERIQSRTLRLRVGAFKTTPVEALQVDTGMQTSHLSAEFSVFKSKIGNQRDSCRSDGKIIAEYC